METWQLERAEVAVVLGKSLGILSCRSRLLPFGSFFPLDGLGNRAWSSGHDSVFFGVCELALCNRAVNHSFGWHR